MFEQTQIQEFKEVGGVGRSDKGPLVGCDLELFPQRSQIGDSWFAARGSMSSFESFCFKSGDNITVTLLTMASPQSFPGAWDRSSA